LTGDELIKIALEKYEEKIWRDDPPIEKICLHCIWRIPSAYLAIIRNDWCERDDKEIDPQQPACDYFVGQSLKYLL